MLPPGATRQLLAEYLYAWVGLRLAGGSAAIPAVETHLSQLAANLQRQQQARGPAAHDADGRVRDGRGHRPVPSGP